MNKILFAGAFAIGALAILWIGRLFLGTDTLGLAVTVLIGAVYAIGTWELLQFRRATDSLKQSLANLTQPVEDLGQWVQTLTPSLQNSVRLRVEGERNGLPAPVLTPYLVGLLVMLGLLGTFVGMVDTLKGAVVALEGTSELEAIRAGLAAPIEGLGLAFGTSVAGVAASAMLGLLSTLSRRERLQASHLLDTQALQRLSHFSSKYQQQLAFKAIQDQAQALPQVAEKLGSLVNSLETMGEQIGVSLLANQEQFQDKIGSLYEALNESVDQSLKTTLVESAELISGRIQPMAETTLAKLSESNLAAQAHLSSISEQQLLALAEAAQANTSLVREALDASLAKQSESSDSLVANVNKSIDSAAKELQSSSQLLVSSFSDTSKQWLDTQTQLSGHSEQQLSALNDATLSNALLVREAVDKGLATQVKSTAAVVASVNNSLTSLLSEMQSSSSQLLDGFTDTKQQWASQQQASAKELSAVVRDELVLLREDESKRGDVAVAHLGQLEAVVAAQLAALTMALEEPMTRLIETASQTPKAAADVIEKLRGEMTKNLARDNDLLSERTRLMEQLDTLSTSLEASSTGQREAIDSLIERSADTLSKVGTQFSERLEGESSKLAGVVDHFASSSADMASLGEAFNAAVMMFSESNKELVENLTSIESALESSTSRSDEQLAYYVSQAREIIDHNLLSHQQIIAALHAQKPPQLPVSEAG